VSLTRFDKDNNFQPEKGRPYALPSFVSGKCFDFWDFILYGETGFTNESLFIFQVVKISAGNRICPVSSSTAAIAWKS